MGHNMSKAPRSKDVRGAQKEEFVACLNNFPPFRTLPSKYVKTAARRLERGCYNANVQRAHEQHIPNYWDNSLFVEQYQIICYNVKVNVDPNSSVNRANEGMSDYLVGMMNSWEMNPHISKSLLDEIELRGNQEVKKKSTKIYKCSSCGGRDAEAYEIQTRSGDEGSTTFIT